MQYRHTKIVATVGPASMSAEKLTRLMHAGVNIFRYNFSHGDNLKKEQSINLVRKLAAQEGIVISILADLQGPKIRTGDIPDPGIQLVAGQHVTLTSDEGFRGNDRIPINYPQLSDDVEPGDRILFDDGLMEVKVESIDKKGIHCQVLTGGLLLKRKGVNLPGVTLSLPALTAKDLEDVQFCIAQDFDFIALSFVRQGNDIDMLRDVMRRHNGDIPVIAKIEKPEAVENFTAILAAADGIMLARGDLGVEMRPERVPLIQKHLIRECNAAGKPVITATQMLESMIHNSRPTRAETSDVANAILDGTDAVMLSGETAVGSFPVQAVTVIVRIALDVEQSMDHVTFSLPAVADISVDAFLSETIGRAACQVAEDIDASAILAFTMSGKTAALVAKHRPSTPVIALTASDKVRRLVNLYRGVLSLTVVARDNTEDQVDEVARTILQAGILKSGDRVVITLGSPVRAVGSTNLLQVHRL